jgi:hypothetical protein
MTDMRDRNLDALDSLIEDTRASLDAELVRERRLVAPDFAAVVAAARARDPEAVSEAAVREAGELAPIVQLGGHHPSFAGDHRYHGAGELSDEQLDGWIADAREHAEADVAARRLAGVPPLRDASVSERPGRGWAMVLAVAAILIGLAVAVPRLLDVFVDGSYREAESTPNQAEYVVPEAHPEGDLRLRPERAPIEPVLQHAIRHEEQQQAPEAPEPRSKSPRSSGVEGKRDRIAQLDAEAQARWAEGDLAGAEQRFREIIELAGRSRYADLAYGDLFTLARQRNDQATERSLWQEYLELFPSGRFADDARAGLCRRAAETEREACWREYLDDFPRGVHTRTAERILGIASDAP